MNKNAAVVADAVTPAGQPHGLADVGFAERAAGMGAIAMHRRSLKFPADEWRFLSGEAGKSAWGSRFVKATPGQARQGSTAQAPNCTLAILASPEAFHAQNQAQDQAPEKAPSGDDDDDRRSDRRHPHRPRPRHGLRPARRAQRSTCSTPCTRPAIGCASSTPATNRVRPTWRWARRWRPANHRPIRWCRAPACSTPARRCSPPTA